MSDHTIWKPTFEQLTESLNISPYHRWLGLKIETITDSGLILSMPWRDEIISLPKPQKVIHGGILSTLIDLTGLYCILSQGAKVTGTAYMNVDFLRTATDGPLVAKGSVIKLGRVISTAEVSVYGPDNRLLAVGRGGYLQTVPDVELSR
ncbi:MAG: hotdog fold thioesterase [Desulfobacterales bacterium]